MQICFWSVLGHACLYLTRTLHSKCLGSIANNTCNVPDGFGYSTIYIQNSQWGHIMESYLVLGLLTANRAGEVMCFLKGSHKISQAWGERSHLLTDTVFLLLLLLLFTSSVIYAFSFDLSTHEWTWTYFENLEVWSQCKSCPRGLFSSLLLVHMPVSRISKFFFIFDCCQKKHIIVGMLLYGLE